MNKYEKALNNVRMFEREHNMSKFGDVVPQPNSDTLQELVDKETEYQSLEEELGIDLLTLFKALENGIYYKNVETYYCRNIIRVGKYFVEVKPIYAVKETTLESCYYKTDTEQLKYVNDAHYWDWKTCKKWNIKDYGKTWWIDKPKENDDD